MIKKGDTLIEVTLAVGIFSMIAIAIVAVMSGGTSSAQTALEATITREEIDAQAEALRFIQSSYIADKDTADKRFPDLWEQITKNAFILDNNVDNNEASAGVLNFTPEECGKLYNQTEKNNIYSQKAFIINTHALGTFTDVNSVYISSQTQPNVFTEAEIYPRLIYNKLEKVDNSEDLVEDNLSDKLYRAEGIYIVAVRDSKTTSIVNSGQTSAFYDFYIRTCWYGANANEPSTISTVIRLYDPDIIKEKEPEE